MVDSVKGYGRIIQGETFEFSLDGISTSNQIDKLLKLNAELLKVWDSTKTGLADELSRATENLRTSAGVTEDEIDARKKHADLLDKQNRELKSAFRSLTSGSLRGAIEAFDTNSSKFAIGVGTLVGGLTGYADKLTEGLQRGVSGGIFDYAIAAKTAGVNIEQFSKALGESAGGFASLGVGATNGAKQFAALAAEVRNATADFGNLGMTNEQNLMFTAQQTKIAIAQGFKGRQAQDLVIKNSRALGKELDVLANRTGKSVLEMAQAAMKLSQDPIVSNFIQTAKAGGQQISKSVQVFAASLRGIFGEAGDALAQDVLKSAFGNLPLVMTKTGQNLILGSSAVYTELERQARIVKNQGELTEQDQERLRNLIIREVEVRGEELRMLANLEGPVGDSARQMLELAQQANFYNSAVGRERAAQDKAAQEFNKELRKFQANLQALAIPFLQLINGIDWTGFISVLSAFAKTVTFLLTPLEWLGKLLGASGIGTVIGGLLGIIAVSGLVTGGFSILGKTMPFLSVALKKFGEALWQTAATIEVAGRRMAAGKAPMGPVMGPVGRGGRVAAGIGGAVLGAGAIYGASQAMGGGSGAGAVGNIAGTVAGTAGAALAGRLIGGGIGTFFGGPIGMAVGGIVGGIIGQVIGDAISGPSSGDQLGSIGADDIDQGQRATQTSLNRLSSIDNHLASLVEQNNTGLMMTNQGNRLAADGVRATNNLSLRMA